MRYHKQPSSYAGKRFIRNNEQVEVLDWFDYETRLSWTKCVHTPCCTDYALRSAWEGLPCDNEVLLVAINGEKQLLHVSELEALQPV